MSPQEARCGYYKYYPSRVFPSSSAQSLLAQMAEGRKRRQEDGGEGEEEDVAPVDAVFSVAGGMDGEGGEASVATGGESRSGI